MNESDILAARQDGKTDLGFAVTRVTLSLRQLGAEPHTKEVGREEVYYRHRLRSARRDDGRRGVSRRESAAGAPLARVRGPDGRAVRRTAAAGPWTRHLLLRSGAVRLRAAACAHGAQHSVRGDCPGADSTTGRRSD